MQDATALRPCQTAAITDGLAAIARKSNTLFTGPTGVGKTHVQINIHKYLNRKGVIITPSLGIVRGILKKFGINTFSQEVAESLNIYTPIRFRNLLATSKIKRPAYIITDEAHHDAADTYEWIYDQCQCPRLGYTATPYRGTPKSTAAFLRNWDAQREIISWADAEALGYITIPEMVTVPLVDDDLIEIRNGEFYISSLGDATQSRFADFRKETVKRGFFDRKRPAVITMPSVDLARMFYEFTSEQHACGLITADTHETLRTIYFRDLEAARLTLIQVRTMGEGVDLPIRMLADCAPTLSPTKWVQLIGRACRPVKPGEAKPIYVCFNRNIQHHGYCLRDVLPPNAVGDSQAAFGGQSVRAVYRMAGIEGFGRVKPAEIKSSKGEYLHLYVMQETRDDGRRRLACLLCPAEIEPYWFEQELPNGKWKRTTQPAKLSAVASLPRYGLTDNQFRWWDSKARHYGIEPEQDLDSRQFQILPILANCNLRLR